MSSFSILTKTNPVYEHTHIYVTSLRSIVILSFRLHLVLSSCVFPSKIMTKISYRFLTPPIVLHVASTSLLSDLFMVITLSKQYKLSSSLLRHFLCPSVTASLLFLIIQITIHQNYKSRHTSLLFDIYLVHKKVKLNFHFMNGYSGIPSRY
jgi:hypothetical protein